MSNVTTKYLNMSLYVFHMNIVIGGKAGSGKSTVAKIIAKKLGYGHYSTGDFMRQMADERGMTIVGIQKLAETDPSIDEELDERQKNIGKTNDNFVIDSRLGFLFVPNAVKIFLDCDDKVRAERIFKDTRPKERNVTLAMTQQNIRKRETSENKRYEKVYGFNCYDKSHFDLTIDTTKLTIAQVARAAMEFIRSKGKLYKGAKNTEVKTMVK